VGSQDRVVAFGLALAGLALLLVPAALFVLYFLAPAGVAASVSFATFLWVLALGWIAGPPLAYAGTLRIGRLGRPQADHGLRLPGARLGMASVVALALGLVLLATFSAMLAACDSPCSGVPGGVSPSAQDYRMCGQPCGLSVGGSLFGPVAILTAGVVAGLTGTVLAAFGLGSAIDALPSLPRPDRAAVEPRPAPR
jgi:hypothetical protein